MGDRWFGKPSSIKGVFGVLWRFAGQTDRRDSAAAAFDSACHGGLNWCQFHRHFMRLSMEVWGLVKLFILFCACALTGFAGGTSAPGKEGVALAIVFDTSGSMKDSVPDKDGKQSPKYLIARRALQWVADRLDSFVKSGAGGKRELAMCLITFQNGRAREQIRFGPFDLAEIRTFVAGFGSPSGGTPLGESIRLAARRVMSSPLSRKHVLVITDGINSVGPEPAVVLPALQKQAEELKTFVGYHFIAFDVDAALFSGVKKLGATVVGAVDERQLGEQLNSILKEKILLEEEEPQGAVSVKEKDINNR